MNIWIFNHYAVPIEYYPHGRPHFFAKYLAEKGHTVTVFAASTVHNSTKNLISGKKPYLLNKIGKVNYVYIRTSSYEGNGINRVRNMAEYMLGLFKNHKKFEAPDCILAMSVHPLACVAGICIAKKYNCGCAADIADLWPESFVTYGLLKKKSLLIKLLYQGEKWIYINANELIFTMAGGKQYIRDKGWTRGIDPKKIHHINNGVDLEEFEYNKEHFQIQDEDLENEDIFKIIYTGSIRRVNNLGQIVECARKLQKKEPKIKFLIWGDGTEREELEKTCRKLALSNISFKGRVEKKYIPYILNRADVNLLHGGHSEIMRYGCSPNKLFDYLAAGQLIVSDIKSGYDLLKKYHCGIVLEKQDTGSLAEAFQKCFFMPGEERETYLERINACAREHDFKKLTSRLEKILESTRK